MSDNAIEDLIEEGVGAVLAGRSPLQQQRETVRALYAFHDRFDTSFTMLRHRDGLVKIGFPEPTTGGGLLSPEPVPNWSVSQLAWRNIELSPEDRRHSLALAWYTGLVSRYLDFDLEEDFLTEFAALEADDALHKLRALAIEAGLAEYRQSPLAMFCLPSWASERSSLDSTKIDRFHIARYLLDTKAELAKVRKAYEKDLKANSPASRAAFYARVEEAFAPVLERAMNFSTVPRLETSFEITWIYYRDRIDGQRVSLGCFKPELAEQFQREFVRVRFIPELDGFEVTVAVQNGRVLAWQQAEPDTDPVFWHFYSNLFADIDEETQTYKALTAFGLWPVKLGMAEKTQSRRLAALAGQVEELAPRVFDLYADEFRRGFFQRKLSWFEKQWDDVISTEALVSFLGDVSLLQAFHARTKGKEAEAQSWFDQAEESIQRGAAGSPIRVYLETKLAEMRRDPTAPLSLLIHTASIAYLNTEKGRIA